MKPTPEMYEAQLNAMLANARRWRAANSEKEALIQFNFPPQVAMIAPISAAVGSGFVSANAAGLELIKALWPWDGEDEATVMMVRAVIEYDEQPVKGRR